MKSAQRRTGIFSGILVWDIISGYTREVFKRYFRKGTMTAISLKLPAELLRASSRCADARKLSRAEYIRRAIERMNAETEARLRAERLAAVSRKVRGESMRVNAEFAAIERDFED
jgi:metal-responsive CopG/Arc/MetJ family transcriptional regulator